MPHIQTSQEQTYDENINRMKHIRRYLPDDAWISTHNLESLVLAGTPVQVQAFCPMRGARIAGLYTLKYCAKSERVRRVETVHPDDDDVARLKKTRLIGSCMCFYRHNGGEIVEMTHDVKFVYCSFDMNCFAVKPWSTNSSSGQGRRIVGVPFVMKYVQECVPRKVLPTLQFTKEKQKNT